MEKTKITTNDIEDWIVNQATGTFHYTKILDGQIPQSEWNKLRAILHKFKDRGICYPAPSKGDGWWRPADNKLEELCWWDGDGVIGENLILPLGMNKYCYIPLGSLVLVAGKYNAGKTAMCINIVNQNLEKWANKIDFYVSENAEMLGDKFKSLNSFIPKPPPFKVYRKTENFADVIIPNHLSIVDYLRVNMEQSYAVSNKLFEIYNKVGPDGIAVVAMQKPPGRKLAFGGPSTAFEPSLYISMDKGYLGFEKIKIQKTDIGFDPYSLRLEFKLKNGVNFYDISEVIE